MRPEEGVAVIGFGLGKTVVEGHAGLRFSPKHPRHLPQFSTVDDILDNSQKDFWALDLDAEPDDSPVQRFSLRRHPVRVAAEEDDTLGPVASTYSPQNHVISEGAGRDGVPVVTFANVLRHGTFPLAEIISELLETAAAGMASPVEMEFAVNLSGDRHRPSKFACLQVRPLVVEAEEFDLDDAARDPSALVCASRHALGHGEFDGLRDVVFVDPDAYDRARSRDVAREVAEINARLQREQRPYLLIGPGRWGSSDPWLGIPVKWTHIAGARVVVESSMPGVSVAASEGTHFFQNMTSARMGYMAINLESSRDRQPDAETEEPEAEALAEFISWDWLRARPLEREGGHGLRWIRCERPIVVQIDGRRRLGAAFRDRGRMDAAHARAVPSLRDADPGDPGL